MREELSKELFDYIQKNKSNFEVSRFAGNMFWHNEMVYRSATLENKNLIFFLYQKEDGKNYYLVMDMKKLINSKTKRIYEKYFDNPEKLKKEFYPLQKQCLKEVNLLSKTNLINIKKYEQSVEIWNEFAKKFLWSLEAIEQIIQEKINQEIKDYKIRNILTFPLYSPFIQQRNIVFLDIAKKFPKMDITNNKLKSQLEKFQNKWGYSYNDYASNGVPSINDIITSSKDLMDHPQKEYDLIEKNDLIKNEKIKLLKKCPAGIKKLIKFLDILIEIRDQRKATYLQINIPFKKWLTKVGKLYKMSYWEISWLTWREQCQLSLFEDKKKFLKKISERQEKCFAFWGYQNKYCGIITGNAANEIINMILNRGKKEIIYGTPASQGKVVGKIKNVRSINESHLFAEGEILVASHTTPDYLPVMRKASAILTERGGITSHAAIVSRELKIPCIVGIKGILNNFKDGDLVEVDAERGIIKKL